MAKGQKRQREQSTGNDSPVEQSTKKMRSSEDSTKVILKTLFKADLKAKHGNISLPDGDIGKMIAEDAVMQRALDSVHNAEERSNKVIQAVGETAQLMQDIVAKDETALSGDSIDDLNSLIERTNHKSVTTHSVKENTEMRVESGLATREELLEAVKSGKISESDFSQKLTEKLEDTKTFAKDVEQKADAAASDIERDSSKNDRVYQEAQAIGFAKRVLKAPGLGDSDYAPAASETTQEGQAQDSGGGSRVTPG